MILKYQDFWKAYADFYCAIPQQKALRNGDRIKMESYNFKVDLKGIKRRA